MVVAGAAFHHPFRAERGAGDLKTCLPVIVAVHEEVCVGVRERRGIGEQNKMSVEVIRVVRELHPGKVDRVAIRRAGKGPGNPDPVREIAVYVDGPVVARGANRSRCGNQCDRVRVLMHRAGAVLSAHGKEVAHAVAQTRDGVFIGVNDRAGAVGVGRGDRRRDVRDFDCAVKIHCWLAGVIDVVADRLGLIPCDIPTHDDALVGGKRLLNPNARRRRSGGLGRGAVPYWRLGVGVGGKPQDGIRVERARKRRVGAVKRPALQAHAFAVVLINDRLWQRRCVIVTQRHHVETVRPASLRIELGRPVVFVVGEVRRNLARVAAVREIALEHHHVKVWPDRVGIVLIVRVIEKQPAIRHQELGRVIGADALNQSLHARRRPLISRPAKTVRRAGVNGIEKQAVAVQAFANIGGEQLVQSRVPVRGDGHAFEQRPPRRSAGVYVVTAVIRISVGDPIGVALGVEIVGCIAGPAR